MPFQAINLRNVIGAVAAMRAPVLGLCAAVASWSVAMGAPGDDPSRIAVVSAFAPELDALLSRTDVQQTVEINGLAFHLGELSAKPVLVFASGIGMVNATMAAQLALDHFDVDALVFSGIGGGVDPDYRIGDVIVPARWGRYLEAVYARETATGYSIPGLFGKPFPNYGMIFPQELKVRSAAHPSGVSRFWFEVDPDLLAMAEALPDRLGLFSCSEQDCLSHSPRVVIGGNGVSGSAFVDNAEFGEYVLETFEARVVDMETAAVATVAFANNVPFIAFRSLSDLAGVGESENEIEVFMEIAAENAAEVLANYIELLPGEL